MKNILFLLPILSGSLTAASLEYTGADGGWWEIASNWTNTETGETAAAKPASGDTLLIDRHAVKLGSNGETRSFDRIHLTLSNDATDRTANASLSLDYAYSITNSTVTLKIRFNLQRFVYGMQRFFRHEVDGFDDHHRKGRDDESVPQCDRWKRRFQRLWQKRPELRRDLVRSDGQTKLHVPSRSGRFGVLRLHEQYRYHVCRRHVELDPDRYSEHECE